MDWNNLFQAVFFVVCILLLGWFSAMSNSWISKKGWR